MANDSNLQITVTEGDVSTINIQPASFTVTDVVPVDSVNGLIGDVVLTTSEITEGTNLYYTEARVDANIAGKTTTDLAEGANLYYTDARVDARLLAGVPDIHTDQLQITGMPDHITWNNQDGTLNLPLNANVTLQVGQEETHLVRNVSGTTLNNGSVVRVVGAQGDRLTVTRADNAVEGTSSATIGVMTETVANNSTGYMTVSGLVRDLDTSAYPEGTALWLGTNGQYVAGKPLTPAHLVQVGWVVRSNVSNGSVFVHIQNGLEMEELHDVLVTNAGAGDLLAWDGINGYWKNQDLATLDIATLSYTDAEIAALASATSSSISSGDTSTLASANAYTDTRVANLVAAAPATLDTLNELAAALGDDPNFATTVTNQIATKLAIADFDTTFDARLVTKSTSNLAEGSNQYFTDARARAAISATGSLSYNPTTGVIDYVQPTNVSTFANDAGYLTSYAETDPVFTASPAGGITAPDITNWNTAYSWGDHSTQGYLTPTITVPVTASAGFDTTGGGSTVLNARFGGAPADYLEFKNPSGAFAGSARLGVAQNVGAGFAAYLGWATNNGNRLQDIKATGDGADSGNHKLEYWMYAGNGNRVEMVASNPTVGKGAAPFDFFAAEHNFNNGRVFTNNGLTSNNGLEVNGATSEFNTTVNANATLVVSDNGNPVLQASQSEVRTDTNYGGKFVHNSNGSQLTTGDKAFSVFTTGANDNGANFSLDGEFYINSHNHKPLTQFEVEHGTTIWSHNYLNITHARDRSYLGKPLRLASIPVQSTAPNVGSENEGEFWLDTSGGAGFHQMKTWRDFGSGYAWQNVLSQDAGDMFWDSTNGRVIVSQGGGYYTVLSATNLV